MVKLAIDLSLERREKKGQKHKERSVKNPGGCMYGIREVSVGDC